MDATTIFMTLCAGWLASALLFLYLIAKVEWVDKRAVVIYAAFGPISFVLMLYFFALNDVWPHIRRLYRRARKWADEKLVIA